MGSALGDAMGELAFRLPAEAQLKSHVNATDRLRYTDDTVMAGAYVGRDGLAARWVRNRETYPA